METAILRRNVYDLALEMLWETPVLSISGARQVGKSTLLRQILPDAAVFNLDSDMVRESAAADPEAFVEQNPGGTMVIDEIQRLPSLFLAIKSALEKKRTNGRFLITGSSNLARLNGAEESLAGRKQNLVLRPLSQGERLGTKEDFAQFAWDLTKGSTPGKTSKMSRDDYLNLVVQSNFPEIRNATPRSRNRWLENYLDLVLTKDVQQVTGIQHPQRLPKLVELIATKGSGEFVAAHVGRNLDLPARSVPGYLSALESLFMINVLPAWGNNHSKRAISKPKVFLMDTGMAAFLTGVDAAGMGMQISSALTGGLVEAFVANELLKQKTWSNVDYRLYHYRDRDGKEVDLILEDRARTIVGLEVKATTSVSRNDFKGLQQVRDLAGDRFRAGIVLHTGTDTLPFGDRLWTMPINALWEASSEQSRPTPTPES